MAKSSGLVCGALVALATWLVAPLWIPASAAETQAGRALDCTSATGVIERAVCREPRLVALDRRLAEAYQQDLRLRHDEAVITQKAQEAWRHRRDKACASDDKPDIAPCLDGYFRVRIAKEEARVREQHVREEIALRPPPPATYAQFTGRWQVVEVTVAEGAPPGPYNFVPHEPRYMGLVLSAEAGRVRWLNGSKANVDELCIGPSFAFLRRTPILPPRWRQVRLKCRGGDWGYSDPLTLQAADRAELQWNGYAILHLKRIPLAQPLPPPPHRDDHPRSGYADLAVGRAFFLSLRSAVARGDRHWIAAQINGTVLVSRKTGHRQAYWPEDYILFDYTPEEFLEAYDWIITPKIKRIILAQDPDHLGEDGNGVMVGRGSVWFGRHWNGKTWRATVRTINQENLD